MLDKSLLEVELTADLFPCATYEKDGVIFSVAPSWVMNDNLNFEDFKKDLESKPHAKRDFGCIPTASDSSYLPNPEIVEIKSNKTREDPWDIKNQTFKEWFTPKQRDYFLHGDFSARKDSCGIAMCHYEEKINKIIVDLMIDLAVPKGGELIIRHIIMLICEIQRRGFNLYRVSYDSWQSIAFEQEFKRHGLKTQYLSVDKDTAAYDTLVEVIDNDQLDYYYQEVFISDMRNLRLVGRKVDHVKDGSKDLSDAVAGSVYQCYLKMPRDYKMRSV